MGMVVHVGLNPLDDRKGRSEQWRQELAHRDTVNKDQLAVM